MKGDGFECSVPRLVNELLVPKSVTMNHMNTGVCMQVNAGICEGFQEQYP